MGVGQRRIRKIPVSSCHLLAVAELLGYLTIGAGVDSIPGLAGDGGVAGGGMGMRMGGGGGMAAPAPFLAISSVLSLPDPGPLAVENTERATGTSSSLGLPAAAPVSPDRWRR